MQQDRVQQLQPLTRFLKPKTEKCKYEHIMIPKPLALK